MKNTTTLKFKKLAFGLVAITLIINTTVSPTVFAISQNDLSSLQNNTAFYDPTATQCISTGSSSDTLDSYTLPVTSGRTAQEAAINADGVVDDKIDPQNPDNGDSVALAGALKAIDPSKRQPYQDYYITMRWNYTSWNWNGTSTGTDDQQAKWMLEKPRLVLVTNPRTHKSIIAAALESGPAPWTGISLETAPGKTVSGPTMPIQQNWSNPQKGSPNGYTGRVSGLAPPAMQYLEATMGSTLIKQSGQVVPSGDVLTYAWAPDQTVTPGPTNLSTPDPGGSAGCGSAIVNGVYFVSQRDPRWANKIMWNGATIGNEGCVLATQAMIISTFTHKAIGPDDLNKKYGSDQEPYRDFNLSYTSMWIPGRGDTEASFTTPATADNINNKVIPALRKGALVAVYSFDSTRIDPFWGTGGHEELIYGIDDKGNFLVYDPWDMPSSSDSGKPDPSSPGDAARHSLTTWPPQAFTRSSAMGFDIISEKDGS